MCGICGIVNEQEVDIFTDDDYDRVIRGIALGTITVYSLDYQTYVKIATKLAEGVYSGYGKTLKELMFGTKDYEMLFELRQNVYHFSAAKVYQQTRDVEILLARLNKALTDDNRVATLAEYHKSAKDILVNYNRNYLTTEYHSAIAQSQMANKWVGFVKNGNCLQYHTVGDGRVRQEHAEMDGIVRPVNDAFWKKYYPPNGWNCRCTVLDVDCGDNPPTDIAGFVPKNVPDIFQFNSGIEKMVFSPKHPYFDVAPKDKALAKRNFNLPLHI